MDITKEFLEGEIESLEAEAKKAEIFFVKAQAVIEAYKMLCNRIDHADDLPEAPAARDEDSDSRG